MSTGLSKKLTMAGSLSREARTCSNEKDHSTSARSDSSAAEAPVGFADSGGLLGSCSLRPTSSILRRRVLENWMN
uniref:Uncharacterized protein n=1 Tax=Lates calcarifer TaxID=8187 RepID=A0A4W6FGX6_LATCA